MSLRYMVAAFRARVGRPNKKLLLLKLADHANDDGICWPGLRRLAADTELSDSTVKRLLNELERDGWLKVERRATDGVHLPNLYRLTGLKAYLGEGGGVTMNPLGSNEGGGGVTMNPGWVHGDPLTCQLEPVKEAAAASPAHARAREFPPSAAAAQQPGGKARRVRQSGIVTWTHEDVIEARRLEREANEELAEAVQAVRENGREPVPGLIGRQIEQLRQRRKAAAAAAQRREAAAAAPPIDKSALERGRRFIEILRRRKEIENAETSTA